MFVKRTLNNNELAFVSSQINRTKKILLAIFVIIATIIAIAAIFIYSEIDENHVIVNIIFGVLIMLLCLINWFVKGYRKHVINAEIYKSTGFYERIYEQHGKNGKYYDTINGYKVTLPWHWRKYLKGLNGESFSYEYIVRDGTVAFNEGASIYVISINGTLSLDYEIKNGLKKAKPISFLNIISIVLILPVMLMFLAGGDMKLFKDISQVTQTKADIVILDTVEELATLTSSKYIQINNAWVYQFKRSYDYIGENYVLSQTERDQIYNNPYSGANYRFYLPPNSFKKPEKETFKTQLKKNMNQFGFNRNIDSILFEKTVDRAFNLQLEDFTKRLNKAKRLDSVLKILKPKTPLFKIYDDCFNVPKESSYSIKGSLENTFVVSGFYNPKNKTIVSFEKQEKIKKDLKNGLLWSSICVLIVTAFTISIFKIIRNSIIKMKLVEAQLNINNGPERLKL